MISRPRFPTLLLTASLFALLLPGCTCESPYEEGGGGGGGGVDNPKELKGVKYKESEKGDPKIIGCADGQREGFADLAKNPRIAGCLGSWKGKKSLRDKPTGKACGDDGEPCTVPADVCAEGWHVCGNSGQSKDLKDRVSVKACHGAGPGRFNAGYSHGQTDEMCPPKPTPQTIFPCTQSGKGSEPVCCGNGCKYGACKDGTWPGKTKISRGTSEGCGALTSARNGGVICCFDGAGAPGGAQAGEAADDSAKAAGAVVEDAKAADAKADDKKAEKPDKVEKAEKPKKKEKPKKAEEGDAKKKGD
jgi:hypothetical protein